MVEVVESRKMADDESEDKPEADDKVSSPDSACSSARKVGAATSKMNDGAGEGVLIVTLSERNRANEEASNAMSESFSSLKVSDNDETGSDVSDRPDKEGHSEGAVNDSHNWL